MQDRFRQLTEPQIECLRLVYTRHSTKEIAGILRISPSAVDKRIERAVQIIGATSRFAAARALIEYDGAPPVDRLPCETFDLPLPPSATHPSPADGPWRFVARLVGFTPDAGETGRERNALSKLQRLGVVLALMFLVAMTSVAMLSVGRTLTDLIREGNIDLSRR